MKALRFYFVMSLVWLLASFMLVACSDKGTKGGGAQPCPVGMKSVNGTCSWDPTNPPNGGGTGVPGGYGFIPNGDIVNDSQFRDFNYRLFNYYKYCGYSYPYGCDDIQVKVQRINNTSYFVHLASASLGQMNGVYGVAVQAEKFTYDGDDQVVFEMRYGNPYTYVIAELIMHQGLSGTSSYYTLNFKDNTTAKPIATGIMKKGYDYY